MSQHILLIQDDARSARAILKALSHTSDESFEVEWVRRCSDGLERLAGVAAILLDLFLPDSSGVETFVRLFCVAPQIPILVLVGPQDEETAKLAVQCGAQDYLFKPRLDGHLLAKTVRSMIERAAIVETMFEEKERAQVTLDSIGDAVMSTDVSCKITYLNVIAERLTGWRQEEAQGHPLDEIFQIVDSKTRARAPNPMALAMRQNKTVTLPLNCILISRGGVEAAIEDSTAPIHDRRGKVSGAVMVFHDVSAARAMALKMSYLTQHDSLTELPNRALMNDRLVEGIVLSKRHQRKLAVLFVDLDRFKHINDSLGHVVGDRLLRSAANRLAACVRSSDTVSRQGGDEFVMLLWEVRNAQDVVLAAENILCALRRPHHIDHHELHITASIGIAIYPDDAQDADALLNNADVAMYHAKESGRDNYQIFNARMNEGATERQALEGDLHQALERRELSLCYQPIVNLLTGEIVGVEALIRWCHPSRGLVLPDQFIEIAEECGLIVPIGRWVLREACRQAHAWQVAGLPSVRIAVNVSSVELRARSFTSGVREILAETGLEARYLELELTETFLMQDCKSTVDVMKELKDIGVRLTLDDFGTGYSSLSYLKRFPIDALKIDRSFIQGLITDADDAGIVTAVIGMGNNLRMRVVAEGIETREQLEFLRRHGCAQGQGFLFSAPVWAPEFSHLLEYGVTNSVFALMNEHRRQDGESKGLAVLVAGQKS
jgi:diguanylate cyclase (GGDEF)-like protein/PAS domain S-box-containing protein